MRLGKKDTRNIFFILGIEVLIIVVCILCFGTFVFAGDYLFQHSVIPDIFRKEFYDTGKLIPDCIFQFGAAQNIYNFSYYGLLSPIILISYLFPTIKMLTYMQAAAMVLFASVGILTYIWMRRRFNEAEAFFGALIIIMVPTVLLNFQSQIVFIESLPFVLLSLIAVDRKLDKGYNSLLIVSMVLMICTNYYSSIVSLACVMIYYGYRYISENSKVTIKAVWSIIRPVLISILISGVLLIPTAYVILHGVRQSSYSYDWIQLFITPDYKDMYQTTGMGITMMFVFAVIAILFSSRHKVEEKLLTVILTLMTFSPIVLYLLNGGNYMRNKISIPLWPLWSMVLIIMYQKIKKSELKYKVPLIIFALISVAMYLLGWYKSGFVIDVILTIVLVLLSNHTRFKYIFIVGTIGILAIMGVRFELNADRTIQAKDDDKISTIVNNTLDQDKNVYRIGNNVRESYNINKLYNDDYMTTSIYTSTHNKYYWKFYSKMFGNNVYYRNYLMLGGEHNTLFNTYMGEKYLMDDFQLTDRNYSLKDADSDSGVNLYENENAFPLLYGKKDSIKMCDFNKLKFPQTMDCLMNYVVTDYAENTDDISDNNTHNKDTDSINSVKTYDDNKRITPYGTKYIKDKYDFTLGEDKEYTINLNKPIKDKYLIIQFDMKQSFMKDLKININGIRNDLSSRSGSYNNNNYTFKYVISAKEPLEKLEIFVQKGTYKISNLKMYTYDLDVSKIKMDKGQIENIDHKTSTINATLNATEDEYLVTTFAYDDGYTMYVDDKKVDKEIVNTAFLGCKVSKGHHNIRIEYKSPWKNIGMALSIIGLVMLAGDVIWDINKKRKKQSNS